MALAVPFIALNNQPSAPSTPSTTSLSTPPATPITTSIIADTTSLLTSTPIQPHLLPRQSAHPIKGPRPEQLVANTAPSEKDTSSKITDKINSLEWDKLPMMRGLDWRLTEADRYRKRPHRKGHYAKKAQHEQDIADRIMGIIGEFDRAIEEWKRLLKEVRGKEGVDEAGNPLPKTMSKTKQVPEEVTPVSTTVTVRVQPAVGLVATPTQTFTVQWQTAA